MKKMKCFTIAASLAALTVCTSSVSRGFDARPSIHEAYGRLPLSFERNEGQFNSDVLFHARGTDYTILLDAQGAALVSLRNASKKTSADIRIGVENANPVPQA